MNITTFNHYKNSLAIQFGMTISGNEALVTAYDFRRYIVSIEGIVRY